MNSVNMYSTHNVHVKVLNCKSLFFNSPGILCAFQAPTALVMPILHSSQVRLDTQYLVMLSSMLMSS